MAYPILPPTLNALATVLSTPADNEASASWPAVDRQTRNWLYDFLVQFFDPTTGKLSPNAVNGGTVPAGSVSGTNPQSGVQQQIIQGSIQTLDLAQGAVTSAIIAANAIAQLHLSPGCVGTNQLQDGAVTASKLAVGSIPGTALQPNSVTSSSLAVGAVTSQALGNAAVQNANIAARAVDGSMLPPCQAGQLLVGGGVVGSQQNCLVPVTLTGAITVDQNGVTTLNASVSSLSYARVSEVCPPGVSCGQSNLASPAVGNTGPQGYSTTTPWQGRGLGTGTGGTASASWQKVSDSTNLLTIDDTILTTPIIVPSSATYNTYQRPIFVNQKCVLMIVVSIPGYQSGSHRLRLVAVTDPTTIPLGGGMGAQSYYLGTSEAAPTGVITRSTLTVLISFQGPNGGLLPFFYIDWFAQTADSKGMGLAVGLGGNEYFGDISIIRLA